MQRAHKSSGSDWGFRSEAPSKHPNLTAVNRGDTRVIRDDRALTSIRGS